MTVIVVVLSIFMIDLLKVVLLIDEQLEKNAPTMVVTSYLAQGELKFQLSCGPIFISISQAADGCEFLWSRFSLIDCTESSSTGLIIVCLIDRAAQGLSKTQ